ncbi:alpha/beta hydrolase [Bacillus sp. B15-48]|uniref:alpha/beta hydrolase n=1 Tax=Bacillus sp. B15-48 TaxID=1548601 RepID=UPI00193FA67A|nr:alpha/beta hydrolase [Bacillus sp. B15-48]MBM4761694.1 alpha/beta hydrolase fold domain-containing protein [Bacillus sp. B15-48]
MKTTITYKSNNHFEIKADFYQTNRKNAPVIVYIHGGGLLWGTRGEIDENMIKLYTDNGFALFSIDYRLAPETKVVDILEDIKDALQWIELEGPKQFGIDAERIAVIGSSAGGYLALNTGTFEKRPRAIVSFYGYGDISASWATTPNKYYCEKARVSKQIANSLITNKIITEATVHERFLLYLYARQTGEWIQEVTGMNPSTDEEKLRSVSPIYNISEQYPPTLLLHGTSDVDVPYEQSTFMCEALKEEGIEAKLITIPNGEHVFEKDFYHPNVQGALMQVIDFLKTHLA